MIVKKKEFYLGLLSLLTIVTRTQLPKKTVRKKGIYGISNRTEYPVKIKIEYSDPEVAEATTRIETELRAHGITKIPTTKEGGKYQLSNLEFVVLEDGKKKSLGLYHPYRGLGDLAFVIRTVPYRPGEYKFTWYQLFID